MSGVPGRSRLCRRYRYPRRCSRRLTASSGRVFLPRTLAMLALRAADTSGSGVRLSSAPAFGRQLTDLAAAAPKVSAKATGTAFPIARAIPCFDPKNS